MKKEASVYIMARLATEIGMETFSEVVSEIIEMHDQITDEGSDESILERVVMYINLRHEAIETANQLP